MAPRKNAVPLLNLALEALKDHLTGICFVYFGLLLADDTLWEKNGRAFLLYLQEALYDSMASTLHDRLGNLFLEVIQVSFYRHVVQNTALPNQVQSKAKLIAQQLAGLVDSPKQRRLGSDNRPLSEPVATALLENLEKLSGLQELAFQSFSALNGSALKKRLLSSCWSFRSLVKFSGDKSSTDDVIKAICENCPVISDVSVEGIRSKANVTDKSIEYLISCTQLTVVNMADYTKITEHGLARLLAESKSDRLTEVKMCYCVLKVLQLLEIAENSKSLFRPIQLKELWLDYEQPDEQLPLVGKLLPHLRKIEIWDYAVPDLSCLTGLKQLENLRLVLHDVSLTLHRLTAFLQIRGASITALKLENETDLPVNLVFQLGALCPNLRELTLTTDRFEDNVEPQHEPFVLIQPCDTFENLEKLDIAYDSITVGKNVIHHAHNIKSLNVRLSPGLVDDEFFHYILQFNLLKQLEYLDLYISREGYNHPIISEDTMKNIIIKCEVLRYIKYYADERCDAVKKLVQNIKQFLKTNNFDVTFFGI